MNKDLSKKYENIVNKFSQEMQRMSSENDIRRFFSQKGNDARTTAQKMYGVFEKQANLDINIFKEAKSEREIVNKKLETIDSISSNFFSLVNSQYDLNTIFKEEIDRHKKEQQQQIKEQALQDGLELWHFSHVPLEGIESGALRPQERPNLSREEIINGVFAFPNKAGSYVLRKENRDGHFFQNKMVLLYKEATEIDDKKVHGYGYKVDVRTFTPSVSNSGIYAGEWTSPQRAQIKETIQVSMKHLRDQGVEVFCATPNNKDNIEKTLEGFEGANKIEKLREMAQSGVVTDYNKLVREKQDSKQSQEELSRFKIMVNAGKEM